MGIGTISAEEALNYGMTGPSLRGSGIGYDIRKFYLTAVMMILILLFLLVTKVMCMIDIL